jgi:hypothetical protein
MLHRSCAWSFAVVALLTGAWPPGQLRADGDQQGRPFRGSAEGMVTGAVPPNELVIDYTGEATHLGRFTREEHLLLNPDGSFTGTIVFTAANGDELWLDFEGAFTSPTDAAGTYTFTGGTGRFQNATGTATFTAYTPDGVNVTAEFEGTIRY